MAIEQKKIKLNWMEQYKLGNDLSLYGSWTPIRAGTQGYVSFLGTPASVTELIKTSKVPAKIYLRMNVYYTGAVNFAIHKQSSRPTGNRPWMGTETGWYVTAPTVGWNQWDLTGLVRDDLISGKISGIAMWNWEGQAAFEGYGVTSNEYCVEWVVEGDWNIPPERPRIDYPTFGITAGENIIVKWTAPPGEPSPSTLKYDVMITDDGSRTWKSFPNATTGNTQFSIDTSVLNQTRKAIVAVRTYDGEYYSEWNFSEFFTIFHDKAPSAPTNLIPVSGRTIDRTAINTFSWRADPRATQSGYQFRWRTIDSGGVRGSWNYIPSSTTFVNSFSQYYNMPVNTIPLGSFEWSVKTQDDFNLQSNWSVIQLGVATNPSTAPNVIYPTYGVVHPSARMTVEWSSVDQIQYELFLKNTGGVTVWSSSGLTNRSVRLDYTLLSGEAYKIQLRVNSSGVWSPYVNIDFSVNFAPPAIPIISRVEEAGSGVTNVVYSQGFDSPVDTHLVEIYRREYTPTGDAPWQLLGGNPVVSTLEDGNMIPPFTSQGSGYWTKSTAGNVTDTVNSSYSLTRAYTSVASTPVWQYYPSFVAGETYTLQTDDIGAYGQLYVRITSGGVNSYYFVRFNTANKAVTFTVPSNYDSGTGYIAINKNDNDPATTGTYMVTNPMLSKGNSKQSFQPKPPDGIRGGFLDYTPASQTLYEYKVVAWNLTNKLSSECLPVQFTHKFNDTIIQDTDSITDLYFLTMVTDRDSSSEVDSAVQHFAGRKDPMREYGENETTEIDIKWEVDTWFEAKQIVDMLNARRTYLYRDGTGRKMFVSTDKVNMRDKKISGFEMSCNFVKTHFDTTSLAL